LHHSISSPKKEKSKGSHLRAGYSPHDNERLCSSEGILRLGGCVVNSVIAFFLEHRFSMLQHVSVQKVQKVFLKNYIDR